MLASVVPRGIKSRLVARISGRNEQDVYPTFYRINTAEDIAQQTTSAGFRIKYEGILETLTHHPRRAIFLLYLGLAWVLRRGLFRKLQADFLIMLCKPDVACACKRLERVAYEPWSLTMVNHS